MRGLLNKIRTISLLAVLAVVATTATTSNVARADASGTNYWGTYVIKAVPVPQGSYKVTVLGTGTRVDLVMGQFNSYIKVCNWNITAEFFDSNNNWYKSFDHAKKFTCDFRGAQMIAFPGGFKAKKGYVCSTLKQNGSRLTSWCATIN